MARYVDADALLEKRWDVPFETNDAHYVQVVDVADIENAPTADVVEIKHGEWKGKSIAGYSDIKCSVCSKVFPHQTGKWNFCPNCGTKMDEGVKDDLC